MKLSIRHEVTRQESINSAEWIKQEAKQDMARQLASHILEVLPVSEAYTAKGNIAYTLDLHIHTDKEFKEAMSSMHKFFTC